MTEGGRDERGDEPADGGPPRIVLLLRRWRTLASWGAVAAFASALLGLGANLKEVTEFFVPDKTQAAVVAARESITLTEAKVDELLRLARSSAAMSGFALEPESEQSIRDAIAAILASGDARKARAQAALDEGRVVDAAEAVRAVAEAQSGAADETRAAAAASWREAGALYLSVDSQAAIDAYEQARALDPAEPDTLLALGLLYYRVGRLGESDAAVQSVLDQTGAVPQHRIKALLRRHQVSRSRGRLDEARSLAEAARAAAAEAELHSLRGDALDALGSLSRAQGDLDAAEALHREAIAAFEAAGDAAGVAEAQGFLGLVFQTRDDFAAAKPLIEAALAAEVAQGDPMGEAQWVGNLGAVELRGGDLDAAERHISRSIEIGERFGAKESLAEDFSNLAVVHLSRQDLDAAALHLERGLEIAREAGLEELLPALLANLGYLERDRGDQAAACAYWAEAEPMFRSQASPFADQIAADASVSCAAPSAAP